MNQQSESTVDKPSLAEPNPSSGTETDDQSFTTKKFYLSESFKEEIKTYARSHYQGNASTLIRVAIKDHFSTLEGDNEHNVKKLELQMSDLGEQFSELAEKVESKLEPTTLPRQPPQPAQQQSDTEAQDSDNGSLKTEVYNAVSNAASPLKLTEIQEQTDAEIVQIKQSVTELVDRGLLTEVDSADEPTYEINTSN